MKRRSFTVTLFAGNLLLVGVIIAVSCGVAYVYLNDRAQQRERAQDERLLHVLQVHFEQAWNQPDPALDGQVKALMAEIPSRLTLIAADGQVRADSDAEPGTMANHKTPDRPEILRALNARALGRDVRPSATLERAFHYLALPVEQDGRIVGVVRLATPVKTIVEGRSFIWTALMWSALAAAVASVALGALISWVWSRPLRQISAVARRVAAGDLTARAAIAGSRETAELSSALNDMRRSIRTQIETIAAQRENLQTVVSNLREGVIGLDEGGHILFMNQSAGAILAPSPGPVTGRHVQSVVRVPEILEALGALGADRPVSRQFEAELQGRRLTLDLRADELPAGRPDGIHTLLVIRDVTDIARMATIKSEFVANASHELRTPLATLRAVVDSLAAIEPDDREALAKFTDMLDRHVRRLENMTNDLLDLHMVEQARRRPRTEEMTLGALAGWAQGQFAARADEKAIALAVEASEPDATVRTDRRLVQLILQNLIDNALKFTPAGGQVRCRFEADDREVRLTVQDTGCGIEPEQQTRVFERFYQADSSRSGDSRVRGTGLGLAIVKYAAERLGAQLQLPSRVGQGTTLTVTLPRQPDPVGPDAPPRGD